MHVIIYSDLKNAIKCLQTKQRRNNNAALNNAFSILSVGLEVLFTNYKMLSDSTLVVSVIYNYNYIASNILTSHW